MKIRLLATTAVAALCVSSVALAQSHEPVEAAAPTPAVPADVQDGHAMAAAPGMEHSHVMPAMPETDHAGHDMGSMSGANMPGMAGMDHTAHGGAATGTLGAYPMTRDASGTSWQPDASTHSGVHGASGGWSLMGHAMINGVYDHQGGPRGDDKSFVAGMIMGAARRELAGGGDTLNLRAMLSPDPLMGARGYPLLLAAGETADGRTTLVDRQHPHEFIAELSASYSHRLGNKDSLFVYAGLPGEPAFGPPAFMHRLSGMDSPEAPITHHWLDSTHITFGVLTAGWVHGDWKLEASRFKGREPDQHRWDIESPKLDSTAVRLSWNPTRNLSLQGSWAELISPEQLDPDVNERRWSASAIYTVPVGSGGLWSTTLAWGRKQRSDGVDADAYLVETELKPGGNWTIFARAERLRTDELLVPPGHHHGPLESVGKLSVGAIHDWRVAEHLKLGLGALHSFTDIPRGLEPAYGSTPTGTMGFVRLVID